MLARGKNDKEEEEEEEAPGEFVPPSYICPLYLLFSFRLLLLPAIIAAATVKRLLLPAEAACVSAMEAAAAPGFP
ncbi:hypothetical protein AAC387_Pa10g1175 [Persea americana]